MALSNRTLSGCLEPTPASGLTDFLFVQAAVSASSTPSTAINGIRRDIRTSNQWPVIRDQGPGNFETLNFLECCLGCCLEQGLGILLWIAIAEHGVARYEYFCS